MWNVYFRFQSVTQKRRLLELCVVSSYTVWLICRIQNKFQNIHLHSLSYLRLDKKSLTCHRFCSIRVWRLDMKSSLTANLILWISQPTSACYTVFTYLIYLLLVLLLCKWHEQASMNSPVLCIMLHTFVFKSVNRKSSLQERIRECIAKLKRFVTFKNLKDTLK